MHRGRTGLRLVTPRVDERGAKVVALRSRRAARLQERNEKQSKPTRPDAA
jgi:hypothetical protein